MSVLELLFRQAEKPMTIEQLVVYFYFHIPFYKLFIDIMALLDNIPIASYICIKQKLLKKNYINILH